MPANIFRDGTDAFDASYARTGKIYGDVAARRAGSALAAGDRQGAMQAMGGEGELDAVRQMQLDQGREDQQAYNNERQQGLDQRAEGQDKAEAFMTALQHLQQVPQAERRQALAHPVWGAFGITPDMVGTLTDEDLSDASIAQFGEQVKLQIVNRGGGGYDVVNTQTGQNVRSVEPDPKLQSVGAGATLYDPETRQPVYTAPKTYAPKGGGGGRGPSPKGYGATPHGPVIDIDPNAVSWR